MRKIVFCLAALVLVLSVTGCSGVYYTDDFVNGVSDIMVPKAQKWFESNLSKAKNITYDLYTNSYVTDCVTGQFELDDETYYYSYDTTNDDMYFNQSISGVSNRDVESYITSVITDYYENTNIELGKISVSWKLPCNIYSNGNSSTSSDEADDTTVVESDLQSEGKSWISQSYIPWNITEEDLFSYWNDVLLGRKPLDCKIYINLKYNTYNDIANEIDNWECMELYPAISTMKFTSPELLDGEYYKVERINNQLVSMRYYQYKTGDSDAVKWRCETLH